jgi:tetratricopeptide (TPR) repeat protein
MRASRNFTLLLALNAAGLLAGCSMFRSTGTPDNAPTIKTLAGREATIAPDEGIRPDNEKTIAAYREFLAAAPRATQRPEAMRRLGDLEMDRADAHAEQGDAAPDYKAAIARYQAYLQAYPNDPNNDRVLYQLSRAYEQGGDLDKALATLDKLVAQYPKAQSLEEAQFRRGELLFSAKDYPKAEAAYSVVLAGDENSPFRERALYMQGWSRFKQGRLDDALHSFFGVLDRKLADLPADEKLADTQQLTRADRELVEDTFRVTSLSLQNLQGAQSIPPYVTNDARRHYEARVYQQLGELYLKQERIKDAADTFAAFPKLHPLDAQAPVMQARVIEIYGQGGFGTLALDAKRDYVSHYGASSEFSKANPEGWEHAKPLVKTHLEELAQHYHASAQKSHDAADTEQAVHWYREELKAFPDDADAARNNFLLAELLYDAKRFAEAAPEYEKSAYGYPKHEHSADAGYAALLCYDELQKQQGADVPALQRTGAQSAQRFGDAFAEDKRVPAVLTHAADVLFALHDAQASAVAQKVLGLKERATDAQRRVAWTILAQTAFEQQRYADAEAGYREVLALTPANDKARGELGERLAAAVYKQAEQARADGKLADAVAAFERAAAAAPDSSVSPAAQYDAAAARIAMKDWAGAARSLESFRQRYPKHTLVAEVPAKLALAYTELGQWKPAAAEYERLATASAGNDTGRAAQWQAASFYEKAGARAEAAQAYEHYLKQYPAPAEAAMEARWKLAGFAKADGRSERVLALMKEIYAADQQAGSARTPRMRTLGASAALALAEPVADAYRKVALVEPLQKNLKLKKARMEDALKAYDVAAAYGVAEVTTESTFRIATIYRDFGKAMLASQRPKKLNKAELEQYNVMLEEQAFPFEEKAIELHEVNAKRSAEGVYDDWVRQSFQALAEMKPARYAKPERKDGASTPAAQANAQGVALREQGQFAKAREAYEQALKADPNYAPAVLNLGILQDLYLGDAPHALASYERYLALTPGGDAAVSKWVADVKRRVPQAAAPASAPAKEKS